MVDICVASDKDKINPAKEEAESHFGIRFTPLRFGQDNRTIHADEEKNEMIKKDPTYGHIICRCEGVSEGEILAAIRQNPRPRDLDGVKRRTRAGMGRCQGGFCSPRVLEILAEELNLDPTEITKCGGKSNLLVGTIAEAAGKENA